jgi:hypothetical protein
VVRREAHMRTKITIIFETHGTDPTNERISAWNRELLEKIGDALQLTEGDSPEGYTLVTFDIVSIEKLAEEP